MAPAEIYAQARRDAESLIRQHAPAPSHDELIALLQPAIVLNATPADDTQIPLGASKFGGAPDVPNGFEWPVWNGKSHTFLAQINLAEVAPFDIEKQLPLTGVLLFFVMIDEDGTLWDEPEQRDGWRVIWARKPLQRQTPPSNSHRSGALHTQRVSFEAGWALDNTLLGDFGMSEGQWFDFESGVLEKLPHRMLACPYAPQLSPLAYAANGAQGKSGYDLYDETVATDDWLLLLQLDTGARRFLADIYDVGWLYFVIRRDELKNGDFSGVWFNGQCT